MTDARPLIVICSGTIWDGMPLPDKMLSAALLPYARILFVDPAVSIATPAGFQYGASRRMAPRLEHPVEGLTRLTTVAPPLHTRWGVQRLTPTIARAQIRWALRRMGETPYAVFDCRLGRLLGGWGPAVRNILYGTDDYVAGAALMGRSVTHLRRDERASLARADTVIAISEQLADRWRGMGADVRMIPNGVAADAYEMVDSVEPAADVNLSPPVAGLVGHMTKRIDIGLLEAVAAAGVSLLLVGPHDPRWEPQRFQRLVAAPHVAWVGRQAFEKLPGYLRRIDVGITPYVDSEFNRASFPLKTLEYLAAGRPAVSTDLPATRWLKTDLVRTATSPHDFVAAIASAAAEAHHPGLVAARRAFAAEHSWHSRAAEVAELIQLPRSSHDFTRRH